MRRFTAYDACMTDEQFDDIKQFILATVSQATAHLATKDDIANMATKDDLVNLATKDDFRQLRLEMQDGFAGVAQAIEDQNDHIAQRDEAVDQRLIKLENLLAT